MPLDEKDKRFLAALRSSPEVREDFQEQAENPFNAGFVNNVASSAIPFGVGGYLGSRAGSDIYKQLAKYTPGHLPLTNKHLAIAGGVVGALGTNTIVQRLKGILQGQKYSPNEVYNTLQDEDKTKQLLKGTRDNPLLHNARKGFEQRLDDVENFKKSIATPEGRKELKKGVPHASVPFAAAMGGLGGAELGLLNKIRPSNSGVHLLPGAGRNALIGAGLGAAGLGTLHHYLNRPLSDKYLKDLHDKNDTGEHHKYVRRLVKKDVNVKDLFQNILKKTGGINFGFGTRPAPSFAHEGQILEYLLEQRALKTIQNDVALPAVLGAGTGAITGGVSTAREKNRDPKDKRSDSKRILQGALKGAGKGLGVVSPYILMKYVHSAYKTSPETMHALKKMHWHAMDPGKAHEAIEAKRQLAQEIRESWQNGSIPVSSRRVMDYNLLGDKKGSALVETPISRYLK